MNYSFRRACSCIDATQVHFFYRTQYSFRYDKSFSVIFSVSFVLVCNFEISFSNFAHDIPIDETSLIKSLSFQFFLMKCWKLIDWNPHNKKKANLCPSNSREHGLRLVMKLTFCFVFSILSFVDFWLFSPYSLNWLGTSYWERFVKITFLSSISI